MKLRRIVVLMLVAAAVLLAGLLPMPTAKAVTQQDLTDIKNQIGEIKGKISQYEKEAKNLAAQANTLAVQIRVLKNQENQLLAEIELSQAEHDRLVIEIEAMEKRIADNLDMIGYIVAQFYYNDEISTLERLASAENLASFIDEEARMSNLANTISGIVTENKALKAELEVQRDAVKVILLNLATQKEALERKREEQQRLLNETRGKESEYQRMTKEAQAERMRLEARQREVEIELCKIYGCSGSSMGDGTKGGYPGYLKSAFGPSVSCPKDNNRYNNSFGNSCQCVSYAAWRVWDSYRISLNIPGNANNWDNYAFARGIPIGTTPKVGSVGMHNRGDFGHVVWVEAVSGNRIFVSEYNGSGIVGDYNEKWVDKGMYEYFIYFGEWR